MATEVSARGPIIRATTSSGSSNLHLHTYPAIHNPQTASTPAASRWKKGFLYPTLALLVVAPLLYSLLYTRTTDPHPIIAPQWDKRVIIVSTEDNQGSSSLASSNNANKNPANPNPPTQTSEHIRDSTEEGSQDESDIEKVKSLYGYRITHPPKPCHTDLSAALQSTADANKQVRCDLFCFAFLFFFSSLYVHYSLPPT